MITAVIIYVISAWLAYEGVRWSFSVKWKCINPGYVELAWVFVPIANTFFAVVTLIERLFYGSNINKFFRLKR